MGVNRIGTVWAIGKDARATFVGWLSAARADCEKICGKTCEKVVEQDDQEKVA